MTAAEDAPDCTCAACLQERDQASFRAGAVVAAQFMVDRALEAYAEGGEDALESFLKSARAAHRAHALAEARSEMVH